jgi:hypothetical protein
MISRLGLAVVWAVAVTLGCLLLGIILVSLKVEVAVTVGDFLKAYAAVIGVLAGLYQFFVGNRV